MSGITTAVIPIGGVGARLFPLTVDTSKSMIRFLNRPLLEFILETLVLRGIREIYLGVSGYVNYIQVYDHFGTGEELAHRFNLGKDELRIRYMPNMVSRGNAEAVLVTLKYYKLQNPVLITQCDTVFEDIDINGLNEFLKQYSCDMIIVLKEIERPEELRKFGVAELGENHLIKRFIEKPSKLEEAPSNLVNTGIYVIKPQILIEFFGTEYGKRLYENGYVDFGRDVIPAMIDHGYRVCGFITRTAWFDIGTPESYVEAVFYFLKNLSSERLSIDFVYNGLKMMGRREHSRELQRTMVERVKTGEVVINGDVLIGRHCSIGKKVEISDSVIDNYTVISDFNDIERSIVMDRCYIGKNVKIYNSIIGRHVIIDDDVVVENSIIGNNTFIGRGARIKSSRIWPGRFIPPNTALMGVTLS
ncbi:MAG: NDP-sugar synthase [Desulfurococcaceae archaeon]